MAGPGERPHPIESFAVDGQRVADQLDLRGRSRRLSRHHDGVVGDGHGLPIGRPPPRRRQLYDTSVICSPSAGPSSPELVPAAS